jgi:hypothetical protein
MLAIVIVAAPASAGALAFPSLAVGLAVRVAVPVSLFWAELSEPPHAVAVAATRHTAAQNNPNLVIVTPSIYTFARYTIIGPNWFT